MGTSNIYRTKLFWMQLDADDSVRCCPNETPGAACLNEFIQQLH